MFLSHIALLALARTLGVMSLVVLLVIASLALLDRR